MRMQEKAAQVGFDWPNQNLVWDKVEEEIQEFKSADDANKEKEFGDILFALVNFARWKNVNPDDALEMTNAKFKNRFEVIETEAKSRGRTLKDMSLEEMDAIWESSKSQHP